MAFNQIEDAFLGAATRQLQPEYEKIYGTYNGNFYLGNGVRFLTINEGPDRGKLTVGKTIDGKLVPDPNITPVNCYNLIQQGETLPQAVNRVFRNVNYKL